MKHSIIAIALLLSMTGMAIAQPTKPPEPEHRGSGRIYDKAWCRWGQDPRTDKCSNLGSGIGN